jgi:hypothetical protein
MGGMKVGTGGVNHKERREHKGGCKLRLAKCKLPIGGQAIIR